jgi:hypothetical protein
MILLALPIKNKPPIVCINKTVLTQATAMGRVIFFISLDGEIREIIERMTGNGCIQRLIIIKTIPKSIWNPYHFEIFDSKSLNLIINHAWQQFNLSQIQQVLAI